MTGSPRHALTPHLSPLASELEVVRLAQTVTHEIEAQNRGPNGKPRGKGNPWRDAKQVTAVCHHGPPARCGRLSTQSNERQCCFRHDCPRYAQGCRYDNLSSDVRQKMTQED